ncbi:MAG: pentapeptide repeat-containing protein, partial [Planctomycetia bacterium]|nr:pentapeptide repeat-containing protein [Planctomycetia bacterium]
VQVRGRGLPVPAAEFKKTLLAGLAEAYGREASAEPEADVRPGASEWFEALESGRAGVRRWNALKADERRAVDLSGIALKGADLAGLKLRGVRARGANLRGAKLTRAELGESVIEGADLSGADLSRAEFRGARASEANFKKAKLVGADLRDGLFAGASFAGADLTDADLRDATLIRADFTGATFDGVNVDGATFDGRTAWPAGFTIPAEAYFVGKDTDPRLVGKGKSAVAVDIHGLIARLRGLIDPKRMKRTADMLKSGKNQLFAQVDRDNVRGIVRSQREENLIYSCVLADDGSYACCTPDLELCMGLRGEPCKHLLVLIIGLARAGQLDVATVDRWLMAAKGKPHRWNNLTKDHVSDSLLRYKGVE